MKPDQELIELQRARIQHLHDIEHARISAVERQAEQFMIAGAMARDLCIVYQFGPMGGPLPALRLT